MTGPEMDGVLHSMMDFQFSLARAMKVDPVELAEAMCQESVVDHAYRKEYTVALGKKISGNKTLRDELVRRLKENPRKGGL